MTKFVGKSVNRVDGKAKVTGTAPFVYDMMLPGMLWAKALRSPLPHAEIIRIDTGKAEKLPGVRAVITAADLDNVRHGAGLRDATVLAKGRVRFIGEVVAAIAADSEKIAEEAVKLIEVEYRELPAVFDLEEAYSQNPPAVLHPEISSYRHSPYMKPGLQADRPNVYHTHVIASGDVEKGLQDADIVVENKYTCARIQHVQMEPHCALTTVDANGNVTIYASENTLYACKNIFCAAFNLSPAKVRVIAPYVGGGFGGKQEIITLGITYGLAKKSGRPVKLNFTREEVFVGAVTRHPAVIYIRDGIKKDGTLVARDIKAIWNGGAYSDFGYLVVRNSTYAAVGTYKIPNFRIKSYGVYTNEPVAGAFRGFGNVQIQWATESQNDILAEKVSMDPMEFRLKNVLHEGDRNPAGELVFSCEADQCMSWVKDEAGKMQKRIAAVEKPEYIKRGLGFSGGNKYSMAPTASLAYVKIHEDSTIEVRLGSDEPGQGFDTVMAQIAAEEFDTDLEKVRIIRGDTLIVPYDEGAISSRATYNNGNAVRLACQDAKKQLLKLAAKQLEVNEDELEVSNMKIKFKNDAARELAFGDVFTVNLMGTGRYPKFDGEVMGKATWYQGKTAESPNGTGDRITAFYTQGAQAIAVAVDTETGTIQIEGIASSFDTGVPINPQLVETQIEGGTVMGIGSAIMEKMVMSKGKALNASLTDYIIPTTLDLPLCENDNTNIAEGYHRDGPYGAKGLGEGTMSCTASAVSNAIYNATGIRFYDLPIEPEELLRRLKEKK